MPGVKLYNELAEYYDLIDAKSTEDIQRDTRHITELIEQFKTSDSTTLLDVGCGTGRHLSYLENVFSCVGIDVNSGVLKVARENTTDVALKEMNMTGLDLEKSFGAITCLFSTIGYVQMKSNLQKTLKNFYDHLEDGGIMIIEPYHSPSQYKLSEGQPTMLTYDGEDVKIARQQIIKTENRTSVLRVHYLIAEKGRNDVQYVHDTHKLGLFKNEEIAESMKDIGFHDVQILENKLTDGAIVGIR